MEDDTLLLEMYKVQVSRSEHYETQHLKFASLLLAISSGLVAIAAIDKGLGLYDIVIGFLVFLLGSLLVLSSWLHYERSLRHGKTAANIRTELETTHSKLEGLRREVAPHRMVRLHHLWYALGVFIMLAGGTIFWLSLKV